MNKKYRLEANDEGLGIAEQVAHKFGLMFDRAQTAGDAPLLVDYYSDDIQSVLEEHVADIRFDNYTTSTKFPVVSAFLTPNREKEIFFDQLLELSLGNLFLLLSAQTFCDLDGDQRIDIIILIKRTLNGFGRKTILRDIFDQFFHVHLEPVDIFPLGNTLTYSTIVFMLCHEIAHHHLNHFNHESSPQQEFEADHLAYAWFLTISDQVDELPYAKVTKNLLCAPIIYQRLISIGERLGFLNTNHQTHPPSLERADRLRDLFNPIATPEAINLYEGLSSACEELENAFFNENYAVDRILREYDA